MLEVKIVCNYISRCSKNEVSFVNEMSLINKGSFESCICILILDFHTTSSYLFQ